MENIILLIAAFVTITGSLYVGYRIGRNGTANNSSRADNAETVERDRAREAANTEAQRALESIEQSNRETAEVLQKMRDLINSSRVSNDGDNTVSKDS